MRRSLIRKLNPFRMLIAFLSTYRRMCYFQARMLGDIISVLKGPKAMIKRSVRKRGLTFTSGWSKRV